MLGRAKRIRARYAMVGAATNVVAHWLRAFFDAAWNVEIRVRQRTEAWLRLAYRFVTGNHFPGLKSKPRTIIRKELQ